jgi:hypothetical protein
MEGNLKYY